MIIGDKSPLITIISPNDEIIIENNPAGSANNRASAPFLAKTLQLSEA